MISIGVIAWSLDGTVLIGEFARLHSDRRSTDLVNPTQLHNCPVFTRNDWADYAFIEPNKCVHQSTAQSHVLARNEWGDYAIIEPNIWICAYRVKVISCV